MERDARLDFFRGLALMMIFINHMPGNVLSSFTLQNLGLSDAAEVFVLVAGISAYFAYSRIFARDGFFTAVVAILGRVRRLYVVHLVLFLLVTSMTAWAAVRFADPMYLEAMALDVLVQDPPTAILRVVTLTYLPRYLDILPLHIALMASLPLVLLLFRVGALAPLAASLVVFGLARWLELNLPNFPESRSWFFNPFAWQLLFVLGLTVAHLHRLGRWRVPAPRVMTSFAVAYLVFAFATAAPWTDIPALANATLLPAGVLPPVSKTNLSMLRLCDVLAQAWLASRVLTRTSPMLETRVARAMSLAGRHSLDVFALGAILSTFGSILLRATHYELWIQIAYTLGGMTVMVVYAGLIEGWRTERRGARPAAPPAGESPALAGETSGGRSPGFWRG